jgi:hypothetical protein
VLCLEGTQPLEPTAAAASAPLPAASSVLTTTISRQPRGRGATRPIDDKHKSLVLRVTAASITLLLFHRR